MKAKTLRRGAEAAPCLEHYTETITTRLKNEGKYAAARGYKYAVRSFRDFAGDAEAEADADTLPMNEVYTPERIKQFEQWLIRGHKWNTVSSYMRSLRAIYNRWMPQGRAGHNHEIFNDVYTGIEAQTKRALSPKQMGELLHTDVFGMSQELQERYAPTLAPDEHTLAPDEHTLTPDEHTPAPNKHTPPLTPSEQRTLAYFLLTFILRGMPFIDLAHLRKQDMEKGDIVYCRHKTGKQLTIAIPPQAMLLIKRFRDDDPDNTYLFPILNPSTPSGWEQYLCYLRALRSFNRTLSKVMKLLLPGVAVSSYTARHTWATIAYHQGYPIGVISQALGHSSSRVTDGYLKPFENARIDEVNKQMLHAIDKGICKNSRPTMRYKALF